MEHVMKLNNMKRIKGFTAVELMVVVAIIGIIAVIAIPSYSQYVVRGNRSAAEAFMMDVASREKQYLLDARAYSDNLTTLGIGSPPNEVSSNYTITITLPSTTPPSFLITATPVPGGRQAAAGEPNLTLDDAGVKAPSGKW